MQDSCLFPGLSIILILKMVHKLDFKGQHAWLVVTQYISLQYEKTQKSGYTTRQALILSSGILQIPTVLPSLFPSLGARREFFLYTETINTMGVPWIHTVLRKFGDLHLLEVSLWIPLSLDRRNQSVDVQIQTCGYVQIKPRPEGSFSAIHFSYEPAVLHWAGKDEGESMVSKDRRKDVV